MNLITLFFETKQEKKKIRMIYFFEQKSNNVKIIFNKSRIQVCNETLYEMHN